jgi:hypothetical protein
MYILMWSPCYTIELIYHTSIIAGTNVEAYETDFSYYTIIFVLRI